MLRDLTVQNYRCFENFHIDGLERVNLFVGNNNSGKTSLLEAIYLLAANNKHDSLIKILINRGEIILQHSIGENLVTKDREVIPQFHHIESIKHIFYNYELKAEHKVNILGTEYENRSNYHKPTISIFSLPRRNNLSLIISSKDYSGQDTRTEFSILPQEKNLLVSYVSSLNYQDNNIFLSKSKTDSQQMQVFWDDIYLTTKEDKVVESLRIIEPKIERIGFYNNQIYSNVRFKVQGYDHPIPLSSMGEGMYCILTLVMSLVTAENGVLLVDEIETGLHYEAQIDMWRLILETAKELNVQVFATTHSWDCIAAFQEALEEVEDQSIGKLFRLDSKYGKLRAVEYNAEDLEIAVRHSIEVR